MSSLDWGTVPQWITAVVAVASLIASFAAWLALRQRAPLEAINQVEKRAETERSQIAHRVARLEEGGRHALTKDALMAVEKRSESERAQIVDRVSRLEEGMRHALTKDDLADLYQIARKTESDVSGIKAELRSLAAAQRDLNNLLLQRGIEK